MLGPPRMEMLRAQLKTEMVLLLSGIRFRISNRGMGHNLTTMGMVFRMNNLTIGHNLTTMGMVFKVSNLGMGHDLTTMGMVFRTANLTMTGQDLMILKKNLMKPLEMVMSSRLPRMRRLKKGVKKGC
jgi:hypothetical protein